MAGLVESRDTSVLLESALPARPGAAGGTRSRCASPAGCSRGRTPCGPRFKVSVEAVVIPGTAGGFDPADWEIVGTRADEGNPATGEISESYEDGE